MAIDKQITENGYRGIKMRILNNKLILSIVYAISMQCYASQYNDVHSCVGELALGDYGNVYVQEDESCILRRGVIVHGDLKAEMPAMVRSLGATIYGDVIIDGAKGDVQIQASRVQDEVTHIYGNVTIKNSVMTTSDIGFPPNIELERGIYVGGSYTLASQDGSPPVTNLPIATLHIHGNLNIKNNELKIIDVPYVFAANNLISIGKLNTRQIVNSNISLTANKGFRMQGYSNTVGGNISIKNNLATDMSFGCDIVDGNLDIMNNHVSGATYPLDASSSISVASVNYSSKCSDQVAAEIDILPPGTLPPDLIQAFPNGVIKGNMNVKNNVIRRLDEDEADKLTHAVVTLSWLKIMNNLLLNNNKAIAPLEITSPFPIPNIEYLGIFASEVAGNLNCSNNTPTLSGTPAPNGPPVQYPPNYFGKDNCF